MPVKKILTTKSEWKPCCHSNSTMTYNPETHEWTSVCKDCGARTTLTTAVPRQVDTCDICGRPGILTAKRPAFHDRPEEDYPRFECPMCREGRGDSRKRYPHLP